MAEPNEESHQSRIAYISNKIKEIAYEKQETTVFQSGDEVEVASEVDGFIGSYYHATILYPIGGYFYKVQYKTLVTDDETAPLEEYANVSEVRPVPPDLPPNEMMRLKIYDMVDVYDNEGWWFGVVTGKIGEKYNVYFPTTAETLAYSTDQLRFHQEWSDGGWILPSC